MTFLSYPIISPRAASPRRYELCEDLIYQDAKLGRFTIKTGADTDGASIPRALWTFVGSPLSDSRVLRAAIVHDQLYCTVGINGKLTRAQCDALFRRALIAAGVPTYRAWVYYTGVRAGGWLGWRQYAKYPARVQHQLKFIKWSST